jgi:hypothetical protein
MVDRSVVTANARRVLAGRCSPDVMWASGAIVDALMDAGWTPPPPVNTVTPERVQAVLELATPHLVVCPSCDAGLPASCACPEGDPRPVIQTLVDLVRDLVDLMGG